MNTIKFLLVAAFLAVFTGSAFAKGQFIPGEGVCSDLDTTIYLHEIGGRKVPSDLKEKMAMCNEWAKNPKKFHGTDTVKGVSFFEFLGQNKSKSR